MASAQQKFWKLVIDSRLLALAECQRLHADFGREKQASPDDVGALARWLVTEGVLTMYQARILLAGRAGPFRLGDYTVMDRHGDGQTKGIYQATSRSAGERAVLFVVPSSAAADLPRLEAMARKIQKAIASGSERITHSLSWQREGSLVFAVLAELSPAAVPAAPPPPPLPERHATPVAQPEPEPETWAVEVPHSRSRRKRRRWGPALVGWGVGLGLIGTVAWIWFKVVQPVESTPVATSQQPANGAAGQPAQSGSASTETSSPHVDEGLAAGHTGSSGKPQIEMVEDDGQTLWASPTSGSPVKLDYLPWGAEAVLILRAAELAQSVEGSKMIEAIGPAGPTGSAAIQSITGCTLAEIDELQTGFYPVEGGPFRTAFVVRLVPALTSEAWTERLSNRTTAEYAEKKYFKAGNWAYYLPEAEQGRLIVVATPSEIEGVIDAAGPRLTKEIERLLADTDHERHFTLIAEPFWIFGAGRAIFAGELARLADPLRDFLGEGVQALLASGYVENELFLELRAYPRIDVDPRKLAAQYRTELSKLPTRVESYLATLDPAPYGKAVLLRFPRMLDQLQRFTRADAEHHEAVLRAYLPGVAAQNLLLASELALWQQPQAGAKAGGGEPKKSAGAAAALAKQISISFARDTLENSLQMVSTEIGVEIVIMGPDLQLEGITKNQSFALDERNQPAGEILRKILKLANSGGKLVYVIKPPPAGGEPILFITTRAAAAKRGDKLPPEVEKK